MSKQAPIPEVRFPRFACDWETRELRTVATFSKGSGYSKSDLADSGVPIILYGRLYTKYESLISEVDTYAEIQPGSRLSTGNEVIVPASGETPEDIARASAVRQSGVILAGDLNVIHPSGLLNSHFLALRLSNGEPHSKLAERAQGKSVVHLHGKDIADVAVKFPSLSEQQVIGSLFERLDSLIDLQQEELKKLRQFKNAMLGKMFPRPGAAVPEVRFPGFQDEWEGKSLGSLGDTYSGLSGKSKGDFGHGEAKFVVYTNVYSNSLADLSGVERVEVDSRQNEVKFGDVFFTTSSEVPEEVGMSSVWLDDRPNVYLNSFCFGWRPKTKCDPFFTASVLRSPSVRTQFVRLAQGISRYNISRTKAMDIIVPIPSLPDEQRKIGEFFKNLDSLIELKDKQHEKLSQIKRSLLSKMFV
ncbi:restriction endonuclease subunit S (plasmid) [Microbacterium sp. NIBRBAC000506063]|nr:restriction endonuclease subunit S [Microbacterium sp. NIBRBAC000506063]